MMVVQQRSSSSSSPSSYLPTTTKNSTIVANNSGEKINYSSKTGDSTAANSSMASGTSNSSTKTVTFIKQNYSLLCACFLLYSITVGYVAGIQPTNEFRFFSYHPLLMTCGMIGSMSIGTITKKIGGYMNTKLHGIFSWTSIILSSIGLYVIYRNKEMNHFSHLKSYHAWTGAFVFINMIGLGMVGGVVLHPDFGIDKTNGTIRKLHKFTSRFIVSLSWLTAIAGLYQLTQNVMILSLYVIPLLFFAPLTLM